MAEAIQAIETVYDGYRFRSRLEARWAVFFHEAGIPYVYEPEGFVLSNNKYYLPDFYLPWFDAYIEIKPTYINEKDEIEARKNLELMWFGDAKCSKVMIFFGDPMDNDKEIFCLTRNIYNPKNNQYKWQRFEFLEGAWFENDTHGMTKHWININIYGEYPEFYCQSLSGGDLYCDMRDVSSFRSNFNYAKERARQARFEHGENPGVIS